MSLTITKENTILITTGPCAYFSILHMPNAGKIRLYYRSSYPRTEDGWASPTRYLESSNGIDFIKPDNDIIFKNSGICHNFFPFLNTNPDKKYEYLGIGGTQWKRKDQFWHVRNKHRGMKKNTKSNSGYRGLYVFGSHDGIKWDQLQEDPVMNRKHPGFTTRKKQPSEFDSALCTMYDTRIKKYILWVRANVATGFRFIQYAFFTLGRLSLLADHQS